MARDLPSDEELCADDNMVVAEDELLEELEPLRLRHASPSAASGEDSRVARAPRVERSARPKASLPPLTPPPLPPRGPGAQVSRGAQKPRPAPAESARAHGAEQEIREGDVLAERYSVVRRLGRAGVGAVLLVRHIELGQHFLFKYLPHEACGYPDTVARFLRGARGALQLTSEHAARTIDAGRLSSGIPYVVTEFLDGSDLRDLIRMRGGLLVSEAVDLVLQAAVAVAEAHRHGIVHGALNPSTLFVAEAPDGSSFVKVMDFGVTLRADVLHGTDILHSTRDAERAIEALSCTAPEQVRRSGDADARTDVWALGALLYQALTGFPAYHTDNVSGMLAMIAADPAPALTAQLPDAPAALERVILRCLEKERRARYASVAELAVALRPFASPECEGLVDQITRTLGRTTRPVNSRALMRVATPVPQEAPASLPARDSTLQRYQVIAGAALIAGGLFGGTLVGALVLRNSLARVLQPPAPAPTLLASPPALPPERTVAAVPEAPASAAPASVPPSPTAVLPVPPASPPGERPPATAALPPAPPKVVQAPVAPPKSPAPRPAVARREPPSDQQDPWGISGTASPSKATTPAKSPERAASSDAGQGRLSLFDDVK